jgi:hypothetical protein
MRNPFRYFNSLPEVIYLSVMMYIRYPLSLRQVEDFLFERGIDICHETVRFWWNRFGPMFAAEIRKRRVRRLVRIRLTPPHSPDTRIHDLIEVSRNNVSENEGGYHGLIPTDDARHTLHVLRGALSGVTGRL